MFDEGVVVVASSPSVVMHSSSTFAAMSNSVVCPCALYNSAVETVSTSLRASREAIADNRVSPDRSGKTLELESRAGTRQLRKPRLERKRRTSCP